MPLVLAEVQTMSVSGKKNLMSYKHGATISCPGLLNKPFTCLHSVVIKYSNIFFSLRSSDISHVMDHNVSSGMSVCGESSGFLSPTCQCGEESHSGGTAPKPVPGKANKHWVNSLLSHWSQTTLKFFFHADYSHDIIYIHHQASATRFEAGIPFM